MGTTTTMLTGTTAPMITPMTERGIPDASAARALVERLDAAGVDRLMLLGSNGEGALIPAADAAPFARDVAAHWRSLRGAEADVLVTVFGAGTRAAAEAIDDLAAAEPTGVVAAPPSYFHHTANELFDHFAELARAGLPVVIYNIPRYSGNPVSPALLERLAALPGIVGVKDSGGGTELLERAVALRDREGHDIAVSQGVEGGLAWALRAGADGITPGLANLAPELCVGLVTAVRNGEGALADALQADLDTLAGVHRVRPGVTAMKAALHLLGLVPNVAAPPFRSFDAAELEAQRAWLGSVAPLIGPDGAR